MANKKVHISDLKTVGDVIKCHLMLNRDADLLKHLRSKSGFLDLVELADESSLSISTINSFINKFINDKPNLTLIDKGESLYALKTDKGAKIYVSLKEW